MCGFTYLVKTLYLVYILCVYVYICVYIYTYVCIHMHVNTHTHLQLTVFYIIGARRRNNRALSCKHVYS